MARRDAGQHALHGAPLFSLENDTLLQNALKLAMGPDPPEDVIVVGIATNRVYDFSEELSPQVSDAIPKAVKIVIDLL